MAPQAVSMQTSPKPKKIGKYFVLSIHFTDVVDSGHFDANEYTFYSYSSTEGRPENQFPILMIQLFVHPPATPKTRTFGNENQICQNQISCYNMLTCNLVLDSFSYNFVIFF